MKKRTLHPLHSPPHLRLAPNSAAPSRFTRTLRKVPRWAWITLGALFILRLLAPWGALWSVNWALSHELAAYEGHVNGLRIHLYRGAYDLRGLEFRKRGTHLPPLLAADRIDLSLSWKRLLQGEVTANVLFEGAVLHFTDGGTAAGAQSGSEDGAQSWRHALKAVIPVDIESLRLEHSSIFFTNSDISPPLEAQVRDIHLKALNLRDRQSYFDPFSRFEASGLLQDQGRLALRGELDALGQPPRGVVRASLERFDLTKINPLLITYVPLTIHRGRVSLYSEVAFEGKRARGYAKVFFDDMKVLSPKQEFRSAKHFVYELGSAFSNFLLKNIKHDSLAAFVPFDYLGGELDPKTLPAIWSAIKNKFSHLPRGFDHSVTIDTVERDNPVRAQ